MSKKTIRTLLVKFDHILKPWEVSAFRGAIIEKVGRENILFNHHIDDHKYLYRYPLIQYKSLNQKPSIFCFGEGVDEIHKLFAKNSWEILLKSKKVSLKVDELRLETTGITIADTYRYYNIHNWLALNVKNHQEYNSLKYDVDRFEMLEKILIGNILSFAKGIDWQISSEVKVRVSEVIKTYDTKYKSTHLKAFDVSFRSNISLPDFMGLGKGVSHGYGMVRQIENRK